MSPSKGYGVGIQPRTEAANVQHVQEDLFKCPTCGKHYIHRSSLVRHRKLECGKEPQFQCPYCPKKSKLKSNLKQHIILKHEGPIARMQ
jgi:predicted RNA-binding Zn-ribbon protein involved in translation (DUF1610 family)